MKQCALIERIADGEFAIIDYSTSHDRGILYRYATFHMNWIKGFHFEASFRVSFVNFSRQYPEFFLEAPHDLHRLVSKSIANEEVIPVPH
jgi:hypothetical protein